jgi:protein SCO1/2
MNDNVKQLATTYGKNKLVYFVSITVDPEHDTAPVLKSYATGFKPLPPKWLFLTGDTTTIYNLARKAFLVNALQAGQDEFIYSEKLILIDQAKRIRGYYTGGSTADVTRLNDEIKVLISEELRKKDKPLY